jgi:5'-nucleotidase
MTCRRPHHDLGVLLTACLALTSLVGCPGTAEPQGNVDVSMLALSSADVMTVDLTVSGAAFPQPKVFALYKRSSAWGANIALPVGNASFTASARDAAGVELFHGFAGPVAILKDQVAVVAITAQQVASPTPFSNAVPVIDSMIISSNSVAPRGGVQLQATAHDPNPADVLTSLWTASAGTFSSSATLGTVWTAPAAEGDATLTLTVQDNHGASAATSIVVHVASANGRGQADVALTFNLWPVVSKVTAAPARLMPGLATVLAVAASDGDGDALTYAWTSSCIGTFSDAGSGTPSFTLSAWPVGIPPACTLTVAVSDGRGGSTTGDLTVPVGDIAINQAPTIISTVQSLGVVAPGAEVTLSVEMSDPEGGSMTFAWAATAGTVATPVSTGTTSQVVWTAPASADGLWSVTVTGTDAGGASTSSVFSLTPSTPLPVKVLAINDFHGQISAGKTVSGHPVGSAKVVASYLKTAMAGKEARTIIAEAGDLIGASPASSALLQDEPSVDFFNSFANSHCATMPDPATQSTGVDRFDVLFDPGCNLVGVPGNHELDEGTGELMRLLGGGNHSKGPFLDNPWRGARFPVVSANITRTDGSFLFRPYVIKAIENVKIAFIGATLRDTPSIVLPSGVAGLTFSDEADAINAQVAILKAQGIHAFVVVVHWGGGSMSGYSGATRATVSAPSDTTAFVGRLDADVDVVITAHSHVFTNAYVKNAGNKDTLVTQAYSAGTAYADIDLTIDRQSDDILTKTANVPTTYADSGAGLTPDATVSALTAAAEALVGPIANAPVTTATGIISKTQTTAGEAPLGDVIAEAHRVAMLADLGITNPGGMRADLPQTCSGSPCTVTWNDCFTAQPFANQVMKITLTGAQLATALEQQWTGSNAAPPYGTGYNKILQISGFTYQWSAAALAANTSPIVVPGSLKKADGTPINPTDTFVVAMNNYLTGGGDGFSAFKAGTNQVAGPIDLDALIAYLKAQSAPVSSAIDGRITRVP